MNDQELNKVERAKFLEIATELGLTVTEQSAFAKVTYNNSIGKVYVARTSQVTRVDLSGFAFENSGVTQISKEEAKELKLGAVRGQLDFTLGEDAVLQTFRDVCEELKTLPQKKVKTPPKSTSTELLVTAPEDVNVETEVDQLNGVTEDNAVENDVDDDTAEFGAEFEVTTDPDEVQVSS